MAGRFAQLDLDAPPARVEPGFGVPIPDAASYLHQAQKAEQWGRFEPALRQYTRCLGEDRAQVQAWVGQVRMLSELGELHEALLWADKALEVFQGNGELLAAKAQAQARLGDLDAALATSDRSIRAAGTSAWRWLVRGEVLLCARQSTHRSCLQRALGEADATPHDRGRLARVFLLRRMPLQAHEQAQAAARAEPQHGYFWYLLGLCQRELGWAAEAASSLERCLELRPEHAEAKDALLALRQEGWLTRLGRRLGRWIPRV
jgi:tetratricopeptide (TPR) repeat protein